MNKVVLNSYRWAFSGFTLMASILTLPAAIKSDWFPLIITGITVLAVFAIFQFSRRQIAMADGEKVIIADKEIKVGVIQSIMINSERITVTLTTGEVVSASTEYAFSSPIANFKEMAHDLGLKVM